MTQVSRSETNRKSRSFYLPCRLARSSAVQGRFTWRRRATETVRAGIGHVEAGEREPRRERARNEGRGPEIGGLRIRN